MKKEKNNFLSKFNLKQLAPMIMTASMMLPKTTFAADLERSTYIATTPVFFTGSTLLFAALATAFLGILGGYLTVQVIMDWFKYIDAEPEERKMHMKGAKAKILGGVLALSSSGLIAWALAFYTRTGA